ncbi:NADH ubiquinone oxidoreductase, 20 kDa subunit [Leptospirillum ferriphilum]|uniref:Hydrogenase n=3 Tax=Leptospirillum TaxID=179 RepID=A0A094W7Z7_9BACT|nr:MULTISPECIES: NADH ubiquinone dehydrogenase [Leptospirillum]EAY57079.1 MAG: putative hydrogenase-3 (HycG) [Leptospirillum rubarum]EDZ38282.1 MAG: Putative NADH ubiquinone oxidoreductase, 20 kDa subunit [Leptospirillum sp. Group II '5-way CG']EIJ75628.1 MAG: Putative NADH ubiquinone oxidoreductase, 20 kDa subunit [Leptospirillum sp. Group II 'C75']AFS53939.1 putative NADH ubiquinone oxidoreductase, 20 kDa subunit [Leptospirillum ferriphilum ML-04]AKS23180.1 hydrogenase [Leptospirillum sp. Gr
MYRILLRILKTGLLTEARPPLPPDASAPFLPVGGSLSIRHVDAGSCNACELELHAMNGSYYAPERDGIRFVASPRHADLLLVTGPVSCQMEQPLLDTHEAMASPKTVLAVGDCACQGGVFRGSPAVRNGVDGLFPEARKVPGCPPSPSDILRALRGLSRPGPGKPPSRA